MNYLCSSSDLISMLALTRGSAVRRNYPKTANPLSRVSLPRRGSERDFIRSWRFNISSSTWEELASKGRKWGLEKDNNDNQRKRNHSWYYLWVPGLESLRKLISDFKNVRDAFCLQRWVLAACLPDISSYNQFLKEVQGKDSCELCY